MHLVKLPGVRECFTESLQAWERHSSKGNSMCKALPPELVSQNTNLVKLCPGSKPIVSPVSSLWSILPNLPPLTLMLSNSQHSPSAGDCKMTGLS